MNPDQRNVSCVSISWKWISFFGSVFSNILFSILADKISKASSRAQVPDLIPTIKVKPIERPTYFTHRRSQSETLNTAKTNRPIASKTVVAEKPKLGDIKPRYLEPRPQRNGLARTQSTTKCKNISSSESSTRNSSPAPTKRQMSRPNRQITEASTNMSRDSLASPAKQNKFTASRTKLPTHDNELSVDSLFTDDSLRSSTKTDKTLSQESLIRLNMLNVKDATKSAALKSAFSRSNPMIHKQPEMGPNKFAAASLQANTNNKVVASKYKASLSCQTTSENSPASITTKSSRLSSITSAVSSPRDGYRGRLSGNSGATATVAPQQQHATHSMSAVKKSFLSAKSKEILAKKQSSLNQSESTKSVPNSVKAEKSIIPVNKSSSTSNILRRPGPFQTTLHLRRTAKLMPADIETTFVKKPTTTAGTVVNGNKSRTTTIKNGKVNGTQKPPVATKIKIEIEKPAPAMRIESKLERSSTFCKESSDMPVSELQIIE